MTMLSFPTDEPEVDPTRPGQWRLAQIELVNWGTFAGHISVDVARAGHLFTAHPDRASRRYSTRLPPSSPPTGGCASTRRLRMVLLGRAIGR
jgi:hypothetical protein